MAAAGLIKKRWTSFSRAFASAGNEITQTFADIVDSIPTTIGEMLEEAPVPPECKPARGLTDDLGAFIRGLPEAQPLAKSDISTLSEKLGGVLRLGIRPEKDLWDWVASYGGNRQFSTSSISFISFKKCVDTLITASAAFPDKGELFVKFVTCALK